MWGEKNWCVAVWTEESFELLLLALGGAVFHGSFLGGCYIAVIVLGCLAEASRLIITDLACTLKKPGIADMGDPFPVKLNKKMLFIYEWMLNPGD